MEREQRTKVLEIFLWFVAAIMVIIAILNMPDHQRLDDNNAEIGQLNTRIKRDTKYYQNSAPIAQKNTFNLVNEQKKCKQNITKSVQFALGGAKDKTEYDSQKVNLAKVLTTEVAEELESMNADGSEDALYNPKDLKFNLSNKTTAFVTFSNVDNIHHAKVVVVVAYQSKNVEDNKPMKHALIELDYDLTASKANEGSITPFSSNFDN